MKNTFQEVANLKIFFIKNFSLYNIIVVASSVDCNIPYYKIVKRFIEAMDKERKEYFTNTSQLDKQLDFVRKALNNLETKSADDYKALVLRYEEKLAHNRTKIEEISTDVYPMK